MTDPIMESTKNKIDIYFDRVSPDIKRIHYRIIARQVVYDLTIPELVERGIVGLYGMMIKKIRMLGGRRRVPTSNGFVRPDIATVEDVVKELFRLESTMNGILARSRSLKEDNPVAGLIFEEMLQDADNVFSGGMRA